MSNIDLNLTLTDSTTIYFQKYIANLIAISPLRDGTKFEAKDFVSYNKHRPLFNGCAQCWLNAVIQMLGYIDDFVSQITTYSSTDPRHINYKNLFTDLINPEITQAINYGTDFEEKSGNEKYGNLFRHINKELMGTSDENVNLYQDVG